MGVDQFRRNHFDCEVDDGSLDRMTEAHRHDAAPRRAVLSIKMLARL